MRNKIQFIAIAFAVALVFGSCSMFKKGNYLPKLKIEIPEVLKSNVEAVSFIKQNTVVINKWSVTLEDLVVECNPYINKTERELSASEKEKLGVAMMNFVANMGEFAVKMAELEQNASTIEYNLNDQELEAWKAIIEQFRSRIDELNKKYQDFGKEEAEE